MQEKIYLYIELFALRGIIQRIILKLKYFTIQGVRVQSWNVPLPEVANWQSLLTACKHAFCGLCVFLSIDLGAILCEPEISHRKT